ncbi:MAG: dUTP diphosphatase [Candidatus Cryosericum sp.]
MARTRSDVRVGVQRLSDAAGSLVKATPGSSGYDLSSAEQQEVIIEPGQVRMVRTGIALELPPGLEGQVRSRSGLAARSGVFVLNSPGTIDSDYRGEIKIVLANLGSAPFVVHTGDRIAQLVFVQVPQVQLVAVSQLTATERGSGGFGSSGKEALGRSPAPGGTASVAPEPHAGRSKAS